MPLGTLLARPPVSWAPGPGSLGEFATGRLAGRPLVVLQGNATWYGDRTNACLEDHRDGAPYSLVVHLYASDPRSSGLEIVPRGGQSFERVLFATPGSAVFLRGDDHRHRSVPVAPGHERLVLVFFLDFDVGDRPTHSTFARKRFESLVFAHVDGAAPLPFAEPFVRADLEGHLAAADLVVAVGRVREPKALFDARIQRRTAAFGEPQADSPDSEDESHLDSDAPTPSPTPPRFAFPGPAARTLAHALGLP